MIQKLRRKFILILMSVVTLILLAVFVSVLLSTENNTRRMSEGLLRQALMIQPHPQDIRPPQTDGRREPLGGAVRNPRAPVLLAGIEGGGEIKLLSNQLHFIGDNEAISAVEAALKDGRATGVLGDEELRWMKSEDGGRIALVDISVEREMLKSLILNSLLVGGGALAVFFLASILLSRWAVRPVESAWERQRQFVADASHELKTPLTVILSNAGMLSGADTFSDEKKARRMEHIQAEALRMKKLVEDLLMLAKSDSVQSAVIRQLVDYSFLVTNALLTFEPVVFDDGKKLSYDLQDKLFVTGDPQRLRQLIAILLDNALKYCPNGGAVSLSLKESEKRTAILVVTNDGLPIPHDELRKIFRRFYRVDRSRSDSGSFGLGLSIAESIVAEHGGKIWAESSDTGNSFHVSLRLA